MTTKRRWTKDRSAGAFAGLLTAIIVWMPLGAADAPDIPSEQETYKPKTKIELRRTLLPMQYKVTQEDGTEPAFRNIYWNNKKDGTYSCIVCDLPLFSSKTKYESGTGWPSFYAPLEESSIGTKRDWKMLYPRTEVHCERCKAHLGHVFNDGPAPSGMRYCMNSASLNFKADEASAVIESESKETETKATQSK